MRAQTAEPGTPSFAERARPAGLTGGGLVGKPAVGDLDGDGDLDVLLINLFADSDFNYFENTAGPGRTPVFAAAVVNPYGLTNTLSTRGLAVVDHDGDGDLDVITIGTDDRRFSAFRYFENTAGPGRAPLFVRAATPTGLDAFQTNFLALGAGDLDGDGDTDVLTLDLFGSSAFRYFENTAGAGRTPAFAGAVSNPFGLNNTSGRDGLAVVDHDGDGDLDVFTMGGIGEGQFSAFRYYKNTAGPGRAPLFVRAATPSGLDAINTRFGALAAGDLDGDGDADLLVGSTTDLGNPDGTLAYFRRERLGDRTITATLTGTDGYRMLAAPSATTSIAGLLGPTIYTQGFPGATDPRGGATVYRYDETAPGNQNLGYVRPGNASEAVGIGQGLFVRLFADEDPRPSAPGQQGGFPKTLTATGRPALVDFDWGPGGDAPLSFTDTGDAGADGWNLLGNPFGSWFDWDAVDLSGVNAPVYVYDNAVASYRSHTRGIPAGNLNGGVIGPFQGFWAQANALSPAITARPAVSSGGPLLRGAASVPTVVGLRLRPGAGSALPPAVQSEAFLVLGVAGAQPGVSPLDARALVPPSASYVLLATEAATPDGGSALLAIDVRPTPAGIVTVELDVSAVLNGAAVGSALVLDWPGLSLPAGWSARLLDRESGARITLSTGEEYPFTLAGAAAPEVPDAEVGALALATAPTGGPRMAERTAGRFALEVTPSGFVAADGGAAAVLSLSAARPNPTAGAAALTLVLPEAGAARVSVVDVLGREVAVLADGTLGAGPHVLRVAPGVLAAGTYVVRAAVGGRVLSQRLTVTR